MSLQTKGKGQYFDNYLLSVNYKGKGRPFNVGIMRRADRSDTARQVGDPLLGYPLSKFRVGASCQRAAGRQGHVVVPFHIFDNIAFAVPTMGILEVLTHQFVYLVKV